MNWNLVIFGPAFLEFNTRGSSAYIRHLHRSAVWLV